MFLQKLSGAMMMAPEPQRLGTPAMPPAYSRPEEGLERELEEVAKAASELCAALKAGLNSDLPPDFPKQQLFGISESLMNLPGGTSRGCWDVLQYARYRLPDIRREHIRIAEIEDEDPGSNHSPRVTRDSAIDTRLRDLIASTLTALDE